MTCREKLATEHPDCINGIAVLGGCDGCPHDYGYLTRPPYCDIDNTGLGKCKCTECWDREIPETENLENEKENVKMADTRKTKQELIEEINELEKQVAKYDRYKQYEDTADELKVVLDSFMNAGFTRKESFGIIENLIRGSFKR